MADDALHRDHAETTNPVSPTVAALSSSLTAIVEESQSLRTDVHAAERARRAQSYFTLGVLWFVVLLVLLTGTVTWQNNQLAREVQKTNERIASCTTAGGACYEEGRQRTGSAISDIIRSEIFMAECSRLYPNESGPAYDRKLETCVAERLASHTPRVLPTPTPTPAPTKPGGK